MAGSQALTAWNSLVRIECSPPTFTSSRAMTQSLQDRYAPKNACFGCGPANEKGLRIRSFTKGDEVVADFIPQAHHEAFPGVLCGGVLGTPPDCPCNWAPAPCPRRKSQAPAPPRTLTAAH